MAIVPKFRIAQRTACKASVLLEGISGRGKTGLALAMAEILAGGEWDDIYAIDTENKSLDLYTGVTLHTGAVVGAFHVGELTHEDGYRPTHYELWREAALAAGAKVLISDSISHMWTYKGGVLDMVSELFKNNANRNKYSAWGEPEIVLEKNKIMDLIRHPKLHTISTVRSKEKQEIIPDPENPNRNIVQSLGEQQIMMPDLKFEPDLVLSLLNPGKPDGTPPVAKVLKSRYAPFAVDETYKVTGDLIRQMKQFLEEGTSPEELLEQQRQDYVQAITEYLDTHNNAKTIWPILKQDAGFKDTPLKDLPLKALKVLFSQLVAD